jgi:hypothetical protein
MAKDARGGSGRPPHLPWFDDAPKKTRRRRGQTPAEKRAARPRVPALASALPRPIQTRAKPPKPIKSAGLRARSLNSVIGRARLQIPRRLVIAPLSQMRTVRLASWFATR